MSQENVEAVYRAYDAISRRDKEALVREMHPEVEGRLYTMQVDGNIYAGHTGMRQFMDDLLAVFPDWQPEILQAIDYGDTVVLEVKGAGRGARSGIALENTTWQVVQVRGGKVFRFQGYRTHKEALEAVGLSE